MRPQLPLSHTSEAEHTADQAALALADDRIAQPFIACRQKLCWINHARKFSPFFSCLYITVFQFSARGILTQRRRRRPEHTC
jgi:hypothetical protein